MLAHSANVKVHVNYIKQNYRRFGTAVLNKQKASLIGRDRCINRPLDWTGGAHKTGRCGFLATAYIVYRAWNNGYDKHELKNKNMW